jgi:hypothetical protein
MSHNVGIQRALQAIRWNDQLCGDLDVFDRAGPGGNRKAVFTQTIEMKNNRVTNLGFYFSNGCSSGNAARQIGDVRRII